MEWDVAISWQLRGLCGNYGMYVAFTGCMWQSFPTLSLPRRPRNCREVATSHSISWKLCNIAWLHVYGTAIREGGNRGISPPYIFTEKLATRAPSLHHNIHNNLLKALFNNVFTLKHLSCMSLHAISVFDKVYKLSPEKNAPQKHH